jgi:hypothetical protein
LTETLDVPFILWSIDARNAIQVAILNLQKCGPAQGISAGTNPTRFSELTGVGFSLWRAAFLASMATSPQTSGQSGKKGDSKVEHAHDLLCTVLASNAVLFGDDRRTRYWMCEYYIDNAAYRVSRLIGQISGESLPPHVHRFHNFWSGSQVDPDYVASARAWMVIFETFTWLVERLMTDLRLTKIAPMKPLDPSDYQFTPKPASLGDFMLDASATAQR